ncbi:uncharacterized protein BHQ10_007314 [Talaromyces amestolkiae]|uniref:Uncharacterized protein n=1 Tax=Talaromyces amestolkiae TaxID=1196081 RepID=A0A364L675_TALAM|nr:uncharacterized protein BHQ10_007314 [Talaromyces amestolkiae]RAO71302.1 hypothetical protein BHQ10_007314 [Talaromyces amestolkiae]
MRNKRAANAGQDSMEKDLSDLKQNLDLALSEIKSSGSFMTQKALSSAVIPGLHVPGVGAIGLPITIESAKAMIQSSRMSPYGKGTETLVNETVRKSWQLDANQFSLQNPLWEKQVGIYKDQAIAGLGLTTAKPEEVKVELYKLLIYEEGAFFLPHQDSEKADGMFATLVISLPSKHEGGEVIASHKGESLRFCTASNSEYGFSWAAWYADVMHEVKPVRSGYRIVSVYNLIHRPSAALIKFRGDKVGSLNKLFAAWTLAIENSKHRLQSWDSEVEDKCPAALVYLLDHQYSIAELSVAKLKGVDRHRFVQLQEACLKNGCDIYLANIEKSVTGGVQDDDYYGGYYGRDPDDEDFEGFTGNEGAHATHFYRPTGLLIVPKAVSFLFEIERLKKDQGDVKHIMEECERMLTQQSDEILVKKALAHVCSILAGLEYHADEEARERFIDLILTRSLEFADFELFNRALLLNRYLSSSHKAFIAKAIADHGLNPIRSALDTKLKGTDVFGYGRKDILDLRLLYDITREYLSVCTQRNLTPSTEVVEWQQATFLTAVHEGLTGLESDGQKVAQNLREMPIMGSLEK